MMTKYAVLLVVLAVSLVPRVGWGGLIGEPAPQLVIKEWLKGKSVEVKAGTNIFVVEIWNTSSASSRACITNLNEIQKRFKANGVVVLAVSDEPVEKISEFVLHEGTNVEYALAADNRRQTGLNFMRPLKQRSIPYAFVIGTNGTLLWHGHPAHGLEAVLVEITGGTYDLERRAKLDLARVQMGQYLDLARRGADLAGPAGWKLLATRTNDAALLCDLAFEIATAPRIAKRDFELAGEAMDQAEKLEATNKFQVATTRAVLLFESGKHDEGLDRARRAMAAAQSPVDKTNIASFLRVMETRLAAMKSEQSKTNQSHAVPQGQVSGVQTNQISPIQSNPGLEPAGKP